MNVFIKSFTNSAKEFRNLKSVVTAALLVAVHTVMAVFLSITVTQSLRISISFLANVVTGALFGPIVGMICGGIGDIVQYVIKPTGAYFPGFTISAMLSGLIYGTAFYNRFPKRKESNVTEKKHGFSRDVISFGKTKANILRIFTTVISAVGIIIWFTIPFATVVDKQSNELIATGSAFNIASNIKLCQNAAIISIIMFVVLAIALVMNIWAKHTIPLICVTIGCFISGLSMYTDKKFTTIHLGYWAITAVMVVYIAVQIYILCKRSELDVRFLVRCVIAMTIVNCLVNGLLGTYWVSMLYGKGFNFYFVSRMIKNLVQLPVNIILTYYLLGFVGNIKRKGVL
jgi:ECF transporter S component (folate family)